MSKKALLTGMSGSHLAEFLSSKNYEVYGFGTWVKKMVDHDLRLLSN
jgi:GDP-D-mannose dehydratase